MERVITMSHKGLTRLEVMPKLENCLMKQSQAAESLEISTRQMKRLWKAYKTIGPKGLFPKSEEPRATIGSLSGSKNRLES